VAVEEAESPVDSLFGILSDRASVYQHDIGIAKIVRERIPMLVQDAANELGICQVHLATIRFNIDTLWDH